MSGTTAVRGFLVRSHRRFPVRYGVTYKSKDGLIEAQGLMVDMSSGGWMIVGKGPEVETPLQLEIQVSPSDSSIRVERAKVQWVKEGVFGVMLERVDPHELLHLKQRIQTLASSL